MKEVREYVENGITPEGLIQPVQDPDARSSSEGERDEEKERNVSDTVAVASGNDQPPRKKETKSKVNSSIVELDLNKQCFLAANILFQYDLC